MFLAGVFLDDSEPVVPPPARLMFNDQIIAFHSISPLLRQTFFVGDGLSGTGCGDLQQFYVPATATRLYLGFLDAPQWLGLPGAYEDNGGALR